jgi:tRNA/rRNA methyltransferase
MGKFRHMYNRAHLQIGEVAMLRGILSQVEWALKNQSQPEVL